MFSEVPFPGIILAAGGTLVLLVALLVLRKNPRLETTHAYIISAATLCGLCLGLARGGEALLLRAGAWMYWPVAAWWLATTFGRHSLRGTRTRWLLAAGLAAVTFLSLWRFGTPYGVEEFSETMAWGRWVALIGVGFWLAALVNLLLTLRGAVGQPRLRRVAALAAFASILPLWPETVTASTGVLPVQSLWLAAILGLLTHLAMADWLLRYRTREKDLQFGRPVAYVSFAVFLLGLYLLLVGGIGKAVEWLGGDLRAFLSALGGVLLALLGLALASSGRIWERIRRYVDRNLYRGEFDFRAEWIRISEELSALPDPRDLGVTLGELLANRMRTDTVFLYRQLDDGQMQLWCRVGDRATAPEYLDLRSEWVDWLWRLGAPTEWGALEAHDRPQDLVDSTRLVVPLIAKQQIVALALLGGRDEPFTAEEKLWLEAAGQQAALAVLAANLTERLIETRELASYHRLSTFVIHDVKNTVSMLSLLLQNLEQGKGDLSGQVTLATLRQATGKLSTLIDRFASARDPSKLAQRPLDLDGMTRSIASRIQASFPHVTLDMGPVPPVSAHGDSDQLARVIENLFINACEAMQGKGRINVSYKKEHGGVTLEVTDDGPGMDDAFVRERLFRPFATTKSKGLGIGLYQSREIARAHGGRLTAQSTAGEGSTFALWLPESGAPQGR